MGCGFCVQLIARQRTQHLEYDAYKKAMELQLEKTDHELDKIDKIVSDNSKVDELHKRRVKMEQKIKNFDVFCDSIYSTLRPKDSSAVKTTRSLGKVDKVITNHGLKQINMFCTMPMLLTS